MQMRHSTTTEELSFLRDRVSRMGRLATILGSFMLVVVGFVDVLEEGSIAWDKPARWWHVVGIVFLAFIWIATSKWSLRERGIRLVEGAGIIGATAAFTIMASCMSASQMPSMTALMAATLLIVTRAIFVPSRPLHTFIIGAFQGIPLIVAATLNVSSTPESEITDLMRSMEVETSADAAWIVCAVTAGWWIAGLALATAATQVIFGLRRKVKEITKLGQYTLEEKLGEGGMGQVFRASHSMLRRPTAVKLLASPTLTADDVRRFESEVQLTAALSHPHTITVYDYGRTPDDVFYYAMEYVDGATLGEIVEVSGPQDPARVVHILKHSLAALAEAHEVGLVHRDIKPANIMFSRQGGLLDFTKVLDFGLVMAVDSRADLEESESVGVMGTPIYMAPESFGGAGQVDGRTDLYALGAVAYFLITGSHVFSGDTILEVCRKHQDETPELPSDRLGGYIPASLEDFIMRCLAKNPQDRPQTAKDALQIVKDIDVQVWSQEDAEAWWRKWGQALKEARDESNRTKHGETFDLDFSDSDATIALGDREQYLAQNPEPPHSESSKS